MVLSNVSTTPVTFRLNRRTVVDEYGAGPPEVRRGADRGVLRRGGKRDFSPCVYVYRGLGERSTRVREYVREYVRARKREKFVDPTLVDTKAGNIN
jgi:hypothetical protein